MRCRLPCAADECSKGDHQELDRGSDGKQNDKGRQLTEEHQKPYTEGAGENEIEDQDGGIVHSVPTGRSLIGAPRKNRHQQSTGDQRLRLPGWHIRMGA